MLPAVGLDVEVVPLVGALDEANAGDAGEGRKPTLDDGALPRREMCGDDVRHVDLSIAGLSPHAAAGGAGISVPLVFIVISNVIHHQGLVLRTHNILVGPPQELRDGQILVFSPGAVRDREDEEETEGALKESHVPSLQVDSVNAWILLPPLFIAISVSDNS